jgi:hypothetical protein
MEKEIELDGEITRKIKVIGFYGVVILMMRW